MLEQEIGEHQQGEESCRTHDSDKQPHVSSFVIKHLHLLLTRKEEKKIK